VSEKASAKNNQTATRMAATPSALCNHGKLHGIRHPATDHVLSLRSSLAGLVSRHNTLSPYFTEVFVVVSPEAADKWPGAT
jgi:hypothetical protein